MTASGIVEREIIDPTPVSEVKVGYKNPPVHAVLGLADPVIPRGDLKGVKT
jgi:hypothetical protein